MGKISAEQRRKEIQQFIEEKGIHRINQSALARKYGCGQTQIRRDIERVMSKTPDLNWVAIFNKAQRDFDRTLEIAKKAMDNAKDGKTKSKLAGQISEMLLRKMSFLEKMERLLPVGVKPEPVTVVYKQIEESIFSPDTIADDEKNVSDSDEVC